MAFFTLEPEQVSAAFKAKGIAACDGTSVYHFLDCQHVVKTATPRLCGTNCEVTISSRGEVDQLPFICEHCVERNIVEYQEQLLDEIEQRFGRYCYMRPSCDAEQQRMTDNIWVQVEARSESLHEAGRKSQVVTMADVEAMESMQKSTAVGLMAGLSLDESKEKSSGSETAMLPIEQGVVADLSLDESNETPSTSQPATVSIEQGVMVMRLD